MIFVIFQWMKCVDHKVKVIEHLMVGHFNWVEDATVKAAIAGAKKVVQ